jgi:branched-chain amino acid transport system substrate-binding protein
MRHPLRTCRLFALGAGLILSGCGESAPAPTPPIFVASVTNLTGSAGPGGIAQEHAIALAIKERNTAGGIHGRPIQYQAFDAASDSQSAAAATGAALSAGAVALVGFGNTSAVLAAAPLARKAGVPLISVGASSPDLVKQNPTTVFLAGFGDNVQAAAAAEFLYDRLHARRVALLTNVGDTYASGLAGYFQTRWQELAPGGIAITETYQTADTEFSGQIARIKALNPPPDALFVATATNDGPPVVLALRQAGIALPIMGGDSFGGGSTIHEVNGIPTSNVYYTTYTPWPPAGPGPLQDFATAYEKEFGTPPVNVFSALAYDGARLLLDGLDRAAGTSGPAIQAALEATKDFAGVTGRITYGPPPFGHIPNKEITVVLVQNGKPQAVLTGAPRAVPTP